MTTELKPCPFCGGKAKHRIIRGGAYNEDHFAINCENCNLEMATDESLTAQDVSDWNTRATPDVPELVRYRSTGTTMLLEEHSDGEYVRYDQAAAMMATYFHENGTPRFNAVCRKLEATEAEVKTLKEINANLMGDDEDKPRYTTKRLKLEIEKAVATALAEVRAQEPVGWKVVREGIVSFEFSKPDATQLSCGVKAIPLYAAPVASEAETIERFREALQMIEAGHGCPSALARHALSGKEPS